MIIKPGTIIRGPNWPEPVEIKQIEEMDTYFRIIGSTTLSNRHVDQIIAREELEILKEEELYFCEEPRKVFLAL